MSAIDPRGQSTKEMPDQPGPSRTVRIVQLDILRGIAILLVLLVHNYFVPPRSAGRAGAGGRVRMALWHQWS